MIYTIKNTLVRCNLEKLLFYYLVNHVKPV